MDPIHLQVASGSLNSESTTDDSESAAQRSSESESLPLNPIESDQIPSVLMKESHSGCDDLDIMALGEPDSDELTQILDDLEHGVHDPTLPCWTVGDVAFEMDDVLISDNEESESDSSMDSGSDTERDFAVDSEIEP